jgi:hypothetical protein
MALDWIKMRTDIYRDPKVIIIADLLMDKDGDLAAFVSQVTRGYMTVTRNVTRNAVVGALVSVWGVIRHQGERVDDDLLIRGATDSAVDDIADLPGLGEAMSQVGWVVTTDDGIVFPGFFNENNADPNEARKAKNAEKQKRYREKTLRNKPVTRDVTRDHKVTTREREEKEKEKSNKETPTPLQGSSADADRSEDSISGSALEFVRDSWNASGPITCIRLTEKLRRAARARLKVPWWSENWLPALERLPQCRFLWGESDRGWKADLEWFLKPDSVQKILEGKYDNAGSTESKSREQSTFDSSIDAIARVAAKHAARSREGSGPSLCLEANGEFHGGAG